MENVMLIEHAHAQILQTHLSHPTVPVKPTTLNPMYYVVGVVFIIMLVISLVINKKIRASRDVAKQDIRRTQIIEPASNNDVFEIHKNS